MSAAEEALSRFDTARNKAADRDRRMRAVQLVRTGRADYVFRGLFPSDWPAPVISNAIDIAAQDTAEAVGVVPTLAAFGDSVLNESTRSRADKLTKVINAYAWESNLGTQMVTAADYLVSYGFAVLRVEPNWEDNRPHIHVDSPMGCYVERDRFNKVTGYFQTWRRYASDLAALFPEHEARLFKRDSWQQTDRELTLIRTYDRDGHCMLLVEQEPGLVLESYAHPLGRIPVAIAQRPTLDGQARGQYDDALWVWAARAKLALLSLEATQKAVEAPIAVPNDVQEFALGPDALIRSASPERIRRVGLELPNSAMIADRTLDDEVRAAARFPEVRSGNTDASVVTGKGVQALMGGFDSRIKSFQAVLGDALSSSLSMALELDDKVWPNTPRELKGSANGSPYTVKYTPAKDIRGEYGVSHEYGMLAGLDPNRALVWGLQALGAGLLSKSFLRRNLPMSLDVTEEEQTMDVENLRTSLMTSIQAYAQAIPEMAANGADASEPVRVIAGMIDARRKGMPVEKAASELFASPQEQPAADAPEGMPGSPGAAPLEQPPGGGGVDIPQQATPGMAQLLAQLSGSGRADTSVRTVRQTALPV